MYGVLRDYQIQEILHEGFRTQVVRTKKLSSQSVVVIKFIKQGFVNEHSDEKLLNEFTLLKSLDSPYIIKPLEYIRSQESPALVLENFESKTLANYIEQEPWDLMERLQIAVQIAEGLGEIHQKNIMHKDIKPHNILVDNKNRVKLIDLSNATSLSREAPQEIIINNLEGTLAYISPEQTARMARMVDYRTDIYSFGVTLYHLFTGQLPFKADNPIELIHMHITQLPKAPNKINPNIPETLSKIILKCMSKNVEDRYKSIFGLLLSLQRCFDEQKIKGNISLFGLNEYDFFDRFHVPQKLYGRKKELTIIDRCLKQIINGEFHLLELYGYSGIGKSSLVVEAVKPAVQKGARYVHYKFDQFNKDIPNHAIATIIKRLIHQMLAQPGDQLTAWRNIILDAVEKNGQIIIDLVPDMKLIIGEQPPLETLSPMESENRFNYVLENFFKILPLKESPLILLLDDAQWIDEASLKLFKYLLSNTSIKHLLIIVAYRDNEVDSTHPLALMLKELKNQGQTVSTISLTPLEISDVENILNEVFFPLLKTDLKRLSKLVEEKTHGNPFFVIQLLKFLYDRQIIKFHQSTLCWTVDIQGASELAVTNNVIDLLLQKVKGTSDELLEFLKRCSLFGSHFDLKTLTKFLKIEPFYVTQKLEEASRAEFISQTLSFSGDSNNVIYQFSHDRIRQVFYDLMEKTEKKRLHYSLGQCLLDLYRAPELEENVVSIVNHLNHGLNNGLNQTQKDLLINLNFAAGLKTKNAQAFVNAIDYFKITINLLEKDAWKTNYELLFSLYDNLGDCQHRLGQLTDAESNYNLCLEQGKTVAEKVQIYVKLFQISSQIGNFDSCYEVAEKAFQLLNFRFNMNPSKLSILYLLIKTKLRLKYSTLDQLNKIPDMNDPRIMLILSILSPLGPTAYKDGRRLLVIKIALLAVELSFKYGISIFSVQGFTSTGAVLGSEKIADYAGGVKAGRFANSLLARFPMVPGSGHCKFVYANFSARWELPLRNLFSLFTEASKVSMSHGNISSAVTSHYCLIQTKILAGVPVDAIYEEAQGYGAEAKRLSVLAEDKTLSVYREVARSLAGFSQDPTHIVPEEFAEELKGCKEIALHPIHLAHYHMCQAIIYYYFDEYEKAKKLVPLVNQIIENYAGLQFTSMLLLTSSLTIAAFMTKSTDDSEGWKQIRSFYKTLKGMGEAMPNNYGPHMWIAAAEMARLKGEHEEAEGLYRQAIQMSKQEENHLLCGICYEVATRYYIGIQDEDLAIFYLRKALESYELMNAAAKIAQIKKQYARYFPTAIPVIDSTLTEQTLQTSHSTSKEFNVDLNTVIEASLSISREIDVSLLTEALMKLMIVNAGANRAAFIRVIDTVPWVYSQISDDAAYQTMANPISLDQKNQEFSVNIIRYVLLTQKQVLLNNVDVDQESFENDPYLLLNKPKAILCFPLLLNANIKGILYLENTTSCNAFTQSHLKLLSILSSQIVISLENAEFYSRLEEKVDKRTKELHLKNKELEESNNQLQTALIHIQEVQKKLIQQEKMASLGMLTAGIAHELRNPLNFIINFNQLVRESFSDLVEAFESGNSEAQTEIKNEVLNSLKIIDTQSARASNIIKDMLSQVHEGKSKVETIHLHTMLEEAIKLSCLAYQKKEPNLRKIHINQSFTENLPALMGYPGDLIRVFINIIDNACCALFDKQKQSPDSYVPTIEVKTEAAEGGVVITIKDNGTGIPHDILDKIYNPFFTTKPAGAGTGLGLWITFDIITKKHNGKISVNSIPGEMTEFTIFLESS